MINSLITASFKDITKAHQIRTNIRGWILDRVTTTCLRCVPGPITPDHLVYARAFPFTDELTEEAVASYKAKHGFAPKVVVAANRVFGIGTTSNNAELALQLSQDGAQVMQLAEAFGGLEYMTERAREFIENWEVESYRQSVAS